MAESDSAPQPVSPDDMLPPVEPPSAGFILQLFLVPGIIVAIIAMLWLFFSWLASASQTPEDYVKQLRTNNQARWQVAFNLATELQQKDNPLKEDTQFAQNLADILRDELEAGGSDPEYLSLCEFLCRAIGEFKVIDGLEVLLDAVSDDSADAQVSIRSAALQGVALLASNAPPDQIANHQRLQSVLLEAADDSDRRIRSGAAYAMGVVGAPVHLDKLASMLNDIYPDARYNAAVGLTRHGDDRGTAVLVEMLDPDEDAGIIVEENESLRDDKHALIMFNALRAVESLAKANPEGEFPELSAAVDRLRNAPVHRQIRVKATDVAHRLGQGSTVPADAP